jgi:hypothetical protein
LSNDGKNSAGLRILRDTRDDSALPLHHAKYRSLRIKRTPNTATLAERFVFGLPANIGINLRSKMNFKIAVLVANLPILAALIFFYLLGGVSLWFTVISGAVILGLVNFIGIYIFKKKLQS